MSSVTITIEQFQSTKRWCDDLGAELADWPWDDEPTQARGWVYADCLYIEEVTADWPETTRQRGRWYLILCNAEYVSDDLAKLEGLLHEYAVGEGIA